MKSWLTNIRFYVLLFSVCLFLYIEYVFSSSFGLAKDLLLTQYYALISITFLYLALLVGPLIKLFPRFPFAGKYLKARRALGVSSFFFALLHVRRSFFVILGGFPGLLQLDQRYLVAVVLSTVALIILFLMAITSFDVMIRKMTFPKWKRLHQFVYLAGVAILIHSALIGDHFSPLFSPIPLILYTAVFILLILHVAVHIKFRKL